MILLLLSPAGAVVLAAAHASVYAEVDAAADDAEEVTLLPSVAVFAAVVVAAVH